MSETELVEKKEETKKAIVEVNEEGFLKAKDLEGQYRIAQLMISSAMVPKGYDNPMKVVIGMQYAIELGLRPMQGLRNIAIINGQPSIWGELPLALANRTGELESIKEFLVDREYNMICLSNKNLHVEPYAAVCLLKRKGKPECEAYFSMDDARKAGLLDRKNTTPWDTYPRVMMARRARSQALKTLFADALSQVTIAEYDFNYLPDGPEHRDVTHKGEVVENAADVLNNIFQDQNSP